MKNTKGFALVEGLLILVIVGILTGTGWFVWNARNKTNYSLDKAGADSSSTTKSTKQSSAAQTDPTADWVSYSSKSGQFSFKYPKNWTLAPNQDCLEDDSFVMLGSTKETAGKYCSDGFEAFGQIAIYSEANAGQKDYQLGTGGPYKNIVNRDVTVSGVDGIRQAADLVNDDNGSGLGAPPAGASEVQYLFFTNNRYYLFNYRHADTYPDVLSIFDQIVTKTLKFSS
jgi:hypothetical protein